MEGEEQHVNPVSGLLNRKPNIFFFCVIVVERHLILASVDYESSQCIVFLQSTEQRPNRVMISGN